MSCAGSAIPKTLSQMAYQATICAALRGEPVDWAYAPDPVIYEEFVQCAGAHGVVALVYYALKQSGSLSSWPAALVEQLRSDARNAAAREAIRRRELSMVLTELAKAGVSPLLLKGTPLAYTLYAEPALRHRSDSDLLIEPSERENTAQVLTRLGYQCDNAITGELISTQSTYRRLDQFAVSHDLDVHWCISNFHVFANLLAMPELSRRAIPVAPLGVHARTLAPADALMLACLHRLGHQQAPYYRDGVAHYDSNRLIWLYDIHLLAQSLTGAQWREFIRLAVEKQIQLLCLDGFDAAKRAIGTVIPAGVESTLSHTSKNGALQVRRFHLPRWRWELSEFSALPTWRLRLELLKQHLVPAPAYLAEKYHLKDRRWLPAYYFRRALAGVWKRLH